MTSTSTAIVPVFNLLQERWIPVLRTTGRAERVGIRTALLEASAIRQIAASNPMDDVALLRLLLAVLQWCKPNPTKADLKAVHSSKRIPTNWLDNLDGHADRFDLLATDYGFYQDATIVKNQAKPATYLLHELPTATNIAHLRHTRDGREGLCPACCAFGLLRFPLFATSAGRGMFPGINQKPPIYLAPIGETLLDTLVLNWPFPHQLHDRPQWAGSSVGATGSGSVGVQEGFTWLPRKVWIERKPRPTGICAQCGQSAALAHTVVMKTIGKKVSGAIQKRSWRDPHVILAPRSDDGDSPLRAANALKKKPLPASRQWREIVQLLVNSDSEHSAPPAVLEAVRRVVPGAMLRIDVVGFATVQNDKYLECWRQRIKIPSLPLTDAAALGMIGKAVEKMSNILDLKSSAPNPKPQHLNRTAALVALSPSLEASLRHDLDASPSPNSSTEAQNLEQKLIGRLQSVVGAVVSATTPGSPLRRREACMRAQSSLTGILRRLKSNSEPPPVTDAPSPRAQAHSDGKPRRPRRNRGET